MNNIVDDLRYSLRGLLAKPGFLVTVVVTLALGLGVNAAIFSLFHQVLMKPLAVPEAQRLVNLTAPGPIAGWTTTDGTGNSESIFSYPMFRDLEQAQGEVIQLAGHRGSEVNVSWQGRTTNAQGSLVSGSYFPVLNLVPALGRLLSPQDDAVQGQAESVVLAHGYWQDRFGGREDVIGQSLRINGLPMVVVGVAPEGFIGTTLQSGVDLFVPISVKWPALPDSLPQHERRDAYWVYVFGRLAPGVTEAVAQQRLQARFGALINEIEAPQQKMSEATLARFKAKQIELVPGSRGQSLLPDQLQAPLATLLAVAGLVLLIACVNIANLQLARGATRANEMAVRSAIGASGWRLRRQLLLESGVMALIGATLALPVAWLVMRGMVWYDSTGVIGLASTGLSWVTVLFTFGTAMATVLLFGLFPAWQLSRSAPADALRARAGQPGGNRASGRFRNGLAVAQMAFSLALLVLAGLFIRSLDNLAKVDLGMRTESVIGFAIGPELNGYSPQRSQQLFERIEDELGALPGVEAVALSMVGLVAENNWGSSVSVQGYEPAPDERMHVSINDVSTGFFDTMGITVLAGRPFTRQDDAGAPKVAIVNQTFAERFGLGDTVVGKRISLDGGDSDPQVEIVGLVADSAYSSVKKDVPPLVYQPVRQNDSLGWVNVYVRSGMAASVIGPALTQAVNRLDSELPVMNMRTFAEQIRQNTGTDHLVGMFSTGFAVLATLLAAVGLYGLLAYAVAQRTREMGLRLALGSPPSQVRGLILRQIGRLALIGVVVGLALAVALGSAAGSLLYGLQGHDPLVLVAATVLLLAVVLAAAWWPAWRASRTDPMVALRDE